MPHHEATGAAGPGLGFTPFETRAEVIVAVARAADRAGYTRIGVAEAMGHASPLLLAEVAQATTQVELATTVLPVWSRSPAVLAMLAADLQRLSRGRFVLGLGAGTPPLVEGLHGIRWQDPFGRLRSVLTAVRSLLEGGRMPAVPEGARPLRLFVPPEAPVPIALASMSPPGIRLAGELADRWLPFLWPRPRLAEGRRLLAEGAVAGDRDEVPAVCPAVPLAVGEDRAAAERIAARWLHVYCTQMGPLYPRMLRDRFGYAAEVDALLAANQDRADPVLPATARRLAEDVLVVASYDEARDAAARWTEEGADHLDLIVPFGTDRERIDAIVAAAAPAVARASVAVPASAGGDRGA